MRSPLRTPRPAEGEEYCPTCDGEGIVWVGLGPDETREECEDCGGSCLVSVS